jgi:hypothetical protein
LEKRIEILEAEMSLKNRIVQIEKKNRPDELILLGVDADETNEEALAKYLAAGNSMPKVVLYCNEQEFNL